MTNDEATRLTILGEDVGTYEGWDLIDTLVLSFYGVRLDVLDSVLGREFDCVVDYEDGFIRIYDDKGEMTAEKKIVKFINERS